ncbi:hypothetical protein B0H12DRAFT_1108928, partial [Mycena haematopus]
IQGTSMRYGCSWMKFSLAITWHACAWARDACSCIGMDEHQCSCIGIDEHRGFVQ